MSVADKNMKSLKLRQKAQEFLSSRKSANNLVDIIKQFDCGADPLQCILTLEMVFTSLLANGEMFAEIVPLRPSPNTPENKYKAWLRSAYEECFNKILAHCDHSSSKIQVQALATAMNLIGQQGKYPLDNQSQHYVCFTKLKGVLMKMLSNQKVNENLINKYEEYLQYDDILFHTWKALPSLTAKCNPNESYILNYLQLLAKMCVQGNKETKYLCSDSKQNNTFVYDENQTKRCLNKIWNCIMLWEHTVVTHKQMLIVLLENVMCHLEKPLELTDFLMDSLDVGGPVSLLALQGIFTLIQSHNLDYPNIYGKLYSMFEPEIFHTKYKARLFYLSDLFLSSTHLPENLVAAFVKRLARLALVAPSEDIIIICVFIGNLILRHPGLKCMINYPQGQCSTSDPYIMEERDPLKSNAINSSLWEIQTLQNHVVPNVAIAAKFINSQLPSVEWDMANILENTSDDIFDKELKKHGKLIALAFQKPDSTLGRGDRLSLYFG